MGIVGIVLLVLLALAVLWLTWSVRWAKTPEGQIAVAQYRVEKVINQAKADMEKTVANSPATWKDWQL